MGLEDVRVKAHLIRNSVRIASWTQMREEIFEITRTLQFTDRQLVPMQIGAHPKSKNKDARNESSKQVKGDDQRRWYHCQKTGHVVSMQNERLKDFADAEGNPVSANSHPNDTAAVVPSRCSLPDEHAMTFLMTMPCVERKTPCEYLNQCFLFFLHFPLVSFSFFLFL